MPVCSDRSATISIPRIRIAAAARSATRFAAGAAVLIAAGASSLLAVDVPLKEPVIAKASNEGEQAIGKMRLAPGLRAELFAAEPLVANPVALTVDDAGKVYVVETFRIDHGIFDIRGHMDWVEEDLASKSVEDRLAMLKRKLGPNFRRETQGDPDRIVLLQDTTGSGRADKYSVFADQFNHSEDGIASSVLARNGNVYLTDIPNLWLLKDTTGKGKADVVKSLSYGYGVRYNFMGHDMHGLRSGPDGKIYFSIGDRAANVTQSVDGSTISNTESGSVFRCNPDGTHLELFAVGLRNPQQLIFDQYGNLFTGDNNPDYGDPGRWCYVIEGGDNGWRVGYQEDHNPVGGGPWMWESLWQTEDKLTAYSQLPAVGFPASGPSGVAYYPGTGLPDRYQNHLFLCDFHGGFTGSGIRSFVAKNKGASFEINDMKDFVWDCLATDIAFTPAGGVLVTDWVESWGLTGKGRVYHIFDPSLQNDPKVLEVKKILAEGMSKRSAEELISLLGHQDMRVRQDAQFELADRGSQSVAALQAVATSASAARLPRIHAIWALGQIADSSHSSKPLASLVALTGDADDEVRAQAMKTLGSEKDADAFDAAVKLLKDSSARPRFFAAMALGQIGKKQGAAPLVEMVRDNNDKDAFIRYAAIESLAKIDDASVLASAAKDKSPAVRLAALEAMRKLASPDVAQFLDDSEPKLVLEAARAINDGFIEPARQKLADLITREKLDEHVIFRVINSNFRLGTPESAAALARFAASKSAPEKWRIEALHLLGDWETPPNLDYTMNLYRPLAPRDPKVARDAVAPALKEIFDSAPDAVRAAAVELIGKLKIENTAVAMQLVSTPTLSSQLRTAALQLLAERKDPQLQKAVLICLKDKDVKLRAAAIRLLADLPDGPAQLESLTKSGSLLEQQAVYDALGNVHTPGADRLLAQAMDQLLNHQLSPGLQLEVLDAARRRSNPDVHSRLLKYESSLPKNDDIARYQECLEGGDGDAGRKIFKERADVSCIRCHVTEGQGGTMGPRLDGIAVRQNRQYMLESIVNPNAKIAPGFESAIVKTKQGKTVLGVVRKDTPDQLVLINNDSKEVSIAKADIVSRQAGLSAMPQDISKTLSKRDLRNLVEYLSTLKDPNAKREDQAAAPQPVDRK